MFVPSHDTEPSVFTPQAWNHAALTVISSPVDFVSGTVVEVGSGVGAPATAAVGEDSSAGLLIGVAVGSGVSVAVAVAIGMGEAVGLRTASGSVPHDTNARINASATTANMASRVLCASADLDSCTALLDYRYPGANVVTELVLEISKLWGNIARELVVAEIQAFQTLQIPELRRNTPGQPIIAKL